VRGLVVLLLAAAANGQEAVELRCPQGLEYRVLRDLDGDGLCDILAVTATEACFWAGSAKAIGAEPDARRALPQGAALFDVGHVGGSGVELVVRTHDAYWALALPRGPERRLERPSGAGLPAHPGSILWRGFFADLDGDSRDDFVDVSLAGYAIDWGGGGRTVLPPGIAETVETGAHAASERLVERFGIGMWVHGSFDDDARPDFGVLSAAGMFVYPGDGDGRFDASRRFEIAFEEAGADDLHFGDLNRDGRTDLVAVERNVGKASFLVADPKRGLAHARRSRIAVPGEIHGPVLDDLDGDGLEDLALPFLAQLAVEDVVRVAARGEVLIKVLLFRNRGGAIVFPPRADAQLTVPVRVRVTSDAAGRIATSGLVVVEHGGDLDGDGRRDLVVTEGTTTLAVHRGVPERIFDPEVHRRIPVPDCADFDSVKSDAADVDGDGLSDILLHYRGKGRRPDRLYLLRSRKE
jgi:hypothetical protein